MKWIVIRYYFILLFCVKGAFSQIIFVSSPSVSQSSWQLPVEIKTNLYENLSFKYQGQLLDVRYPQDNYTWYDYRLNNKSYINLQSNVIYKRDNLVLLAGRSYYPIGFSRLVGLFISPTAPSLDQISIVIDNYHGFNYRHSIIRLDNRLKNDDINHVVNRWYYLNMVGYSYKHITVNFIDAVISTGYNRGIEWYYANPLVSLFMERKHELHRNEGQDSTSIIGIGDNDNHFIGGNWRININRLNLYGEWLIDEWQLASESRDNMQTVFGTMLGFGLITNSLEVNIEYSLASPWLYINRALYGSLEKHYQPIGLRSPQSQSLNIVIKYIYNKQSYVEITSRIEQRGNQTFYTPWNAWDNNIPIFDFESTLPTEFRIIYSNSTGKYFHRLGLYHNWFQSGNTQLIVGWDFSLRFE